jgi:hypothetical protein
MAGVCIYLLQYAVLNLPPDAPADLSKRLAGEWDFRDFSCLSPAKENRCQPTNPA